MKFPFGLNNLLVGLVASEIPDICKGMFIELLSGVSIKEASDWVERNENLWAHIGTEHREQIQTYAPKIHDWSWLTEDWLIESISEELPTLASLFLPWDEGRAYLARQIEDLKVQAGVDI